MYSRKIMSYSCNFMTCSRTQIQIRTLLHSHWKSNLRNYLTILSTMIKWYRTWRPPLKRGMGRRSKFGKENFSQEKCKIANVCISSELDNKPKCNCPWCCQNANFPIHFCLLSRTLRWAIKLRVKYCKVLIKWKKKVTICSQ